MKTLVISTLCALSGCATVGAASSAEVLLATDRAFAAEAAAKGLQASFAHYAAEDAWLLAKSGVKQGRTAVSEAFAGSDDVELTWEPKAGELSSAGDVGFTWGTWSRRRKSDTSGAVLTGRYLTTWRKTPEGYRWTADLGDTDPPAKP